VYIQTTGCPGRFLLAVALLNRSVVHGVLPIATVLSMVAKCATSQVAQYIATFSCGGLARVERRRCQ
jgi:hypothetical protein